VLLVLPFGSATRTIARSVAGSASRGPLRYEGTPCRIVTLADLIPNGWTCEGCGYLFDVGDVAYGELTGMVGPDPVESNWRCVTCREAAA